MGTLFVRLSAVLPALLLRWSAVAMTGGALLGTMPALAQSYPTKPIRLIVPYPPGGTTDFVAREVGSKVGELLGAQIVIDNRPGAGTLIGLALGVKAAPDGYTITF